VIPKRSKSIKGTILPQAPTWGAHATFTIYAPSLQPPVAGDWHRHAARMSFEVILGCVGKPSVGKSTFFNAVTDGKVGPEGSFCMAQACCGVCEEARHDTLMWRMQFYSCLVCLVLYTGEGWELSLHHDRGQGVIGMLSFAPSLTSVHFFVAAEYWYQSLSGAVSVLCPREDRRMSAQVSSVHPFDDGTRVVELICQVSYLTLTQIWSVRWGHAVYPGQAA
jgi:GTPase SAR1 family protein